MAIHALHMTSLDAMRACFRAITTTPASILHLEGYGLEPGCFADLVVLDAADPIDAIRAKAARLQVLRRGQVIVRHPRPPHPPHPPRPAAGGGPFAAGSGVIGAPILSPSSAAAGTAPAPAPG
jgi:cytosine/creatinine deaminase